MTLITRASSTVGYTELPVRFTRVDGLLWAGLRQNWIEGEAEDGTAVEVDTSLQNGCLLFTVTLDDGRKVHEYIDVAAIAEQRAAAIVADPDVVEVKQ